MPATLQLTAFEGTRQIASGDLLAITEAVSKAIARGGSAPVLVFDDRTGAQIDLDVRSAVANVGQQEDDSAEQRGVGRPRLGVVSREVTLLPRHWEWLGRRSGAPPLP